MKLRWAAVFILLLFAVSSAVLSATIAKVTVPGEKPYIYWFGYSDAAGQKQLTQPIRFRGPDETIDSVVELLKAKNIKLHVLDPASGNEAISDIQIKPDKPADIKLSASSFKTVRQVQIKIVNTKGKLLESALATLTDANGDRQTQILEPTTRGMVTFFDVPSGAASVKVVYGDGKSSLQDVEIPLDREDAIASAEVPVAGDVPTLREAAKQAAGTKEKKPSERAVSGLQTAVAALIGLVILAGLLVVLYVMLKTKGITAKSTLERMGAQFPEVGTSQPQGQPAPLTPEGTCPFCGQKKDPVTGACACSVTSPAAVSSGPRLVGVQGPYLGKIFEITSSGATIGRGPDNTIPLVDDSTASRHHSAIVVQGGACIIRDQGSSNGTFVNGAKITEQTLKSGDEVQIGSTRFRFEA